MKFRGEIWLTNLEPSIGAEIRKTRPAVIINDDNVGILPLKIIAPITDWKPNFDKILWMIKIEPDDKNGLSKTSVIDAFQIRCLSEQRFIKRLGQISDEI